jgi:hypothetical protein
MDRSDRQAREASLFDTRNCSGGKAPHLARSSSTNVALGVTHASAAECADCGLRAFDSSHCDQALAVVCWFEHCCSGFPPDARRWPSLRSVCMPAGVAGKALRSGCVHHVPSCAAKFHFVHTFVYLVPRKLNIHCFDRVMRVRDALRFHLRIHRRGRDSPLHRLQQEPYDARRWRPQWSS